MVSRMKDSIMGSTEICEDLTKVSVLCAILKDLYTVLPEQGFSVTIFNSIDGDELFLCITLKHFDAIEFYATRDQIPMQIRSDFIEKLDIDQDPNDPCSSPPSMPYDPHLIQ